MITLRKSHDRGRSDLGWLDSRFSFSFADYHDPAHMGFRALRVINDDRIAPGGGFGAHPHRDMEIVTYMLDGALAHQDSMGNGSTIRPGEIQRMSAGRGVIHSEKNASGTDPIRLLQIWIVPRSRGAVPGYEQKTLAPADLANRLHLAASGTDRRGTVTIDQDAEIWVGRLAPKATVRHAFAPGRHGWLQMARGSADVNGVALAEGDGVAISDEREIVVTAKDAAEVLLFDLA
jgi:redox-sensitive bicupin YhaK (pirin superfamily)